MKRLLLAIGLCITLSGKAALFPNAFTTNATGPSLGGAFPSALTNNQSTPTAIANTLTVAPGGALGPYIIGKNTGTTNGPYVFGNQTIERADTMSWDNTAGSIQYGIYDSSGNMIWGGTANNNNKFFAPLMVGTAGMLTNQMPVTGEMDYMYPVPIFIVNSFFDMGTAPNGTYTTNTIALLKTVFPGWYNTGWSNVWYDDGMLTNRVGVALHLTNNSTAFPQGITGIVTYAHSQGFNIGAYVAHSQAFCGGGPGQPTTDEFIYQDIYDIGAMGFDFLKIDTCGTDTPYQGLPYGPGTATTLTRRYQMFPEANMFMSRQLGRKPLFILATEVPNFPNIPSRGAWTPHYTLAAFNLSENASPIGGAGVVGGNVTNFCFEQTAFCAHRPGHTHRLTSPNSTIGPTKEYVSLCVLGPSSVQVNLTNVIGSGTLSLYYTNAFVNALITHPLVRGGFEVISNSVNHVVTIARPLGPSNGRATTSSSFNGGGFVPGLGLGGYTTFGTDGTNAVGVFNLDSGAHTQVINVNNVGMASNSPIQVIDVWNNSSQGYFTNQWTSPSIAAGDCALYLFILPPVGTNFVTYAAGTAYTLTATPALLDFGTTDPIITLQDAGTYKITSGVGMKYVAATYAGAQTVTLKLRRTNNTATDLTSGGRTVELPVLTTFTGGDFIGLPPVYYTANAGDIIQIFGSVSATPSAGSVTTDSAEITADLVRAQ